MGYSGIRHLTGIDSSYRHNLSLCSKVNWDLKVPERKESTYMNGVSSRQQTTSARKSRIQSPHSSDTVS